MCVCLFAPSRGQPLCFSLRTNFPDHALMFTDGSKKSDPSMVGCVRLVVPINECTSNL